MGFCKVIPNCNDCGPVLFIPDPDSNPNLDQNLELTESKRFKFSVDFTLLEVLYDFQRINEEVTEQIYNFLYC